MGFWYRIGKDIAGYLNLSKEALVTTPFVENFERRILDNLLLKQF